MTLEIGKQLSEVLVVLIVVAGIVLAIKYGG